MAIEKKSKADIQRDYRAKLKEAGMVRVEVVIPKEEEPNLKTWAEEVRQEAGDARGEGDE